MSQETLGRKTARLSATGALVRAHDRDRFQTALFAAAGPREALFALYAFNYEIARVRESVREPLLGQIRLQWWRDVIAAAYAGEPTRRHDVAEALTATIRAHDLSREHFDRLIDARERDLAGAAPANLPELEDYAEASSAPLVLLALEVLGAASPPVQAVARAAGTAYALAGLLRAMPLHAATGRLWIPADIVVETGMQLRDYEALRASPALRQAVAAVAAAARRHLAAARQWRHAVPRAALPALLPARVAELSLRRLQRAGYDPFAATGGSDPLQSWRLTLAVLRGVF